MSVGSPIQRLPVELLSRILQSLVRPNGLPEHALVSKQWRHIAYHVQHELHLPDNLDLDPRRLVQILSPFINLEKLILPSGSLTSASNIFFSRPADVCPHLTELRVEPMPRNAAIPPSIDRPTRLKNLTIEARFTRLPDTLTSLHPLRSLVLNTYSLEDLLKDFGNLVSLTSLELQYCRLTSLPVSFGQLAALSRLSLIHCVTLQLPVSLSKLSSLSVLNVRRCTLLPLSPVNYRRLQALETLILVGLTGMRDFIAAFEHLQRVKTLTIRDSSDITSLPASLPRLPALTNLTLDMPLLPVQPDDFGQLSELRTLVLDLMSLTALPDSIALVTTLRELSLNQLLNLTHLPREFGQLVALEKLCMKSLHQLTHLPESFGQLTTLRELKFLECRQLQRLPASLSQLSSLEYLEINICPDLTSLPDDMGKRLNSLRHLLLLH
ncbi:unnamed protein product [Closterium sp. NIES-54]